MQEIRVAKPKTSQNDLRKRNQCGRIKKKDKSVEFNEIFKEVLKDDRV